MTMRDSSVWKFENSNDVIPCSTTEHSKPLYVLTVQRKIQLKETLVSFLLFYDMFLAGCERRGILCG